MVALGDGVLVFADVMVGDEATSAFLYLDDKGNSQIFREFDPGSDIIHQYTRTNLPGMASIGETGYILLFDQGTESIIRPRLLEVTFSDEPREIDGYPGDIQSRPRLRTRTELTDDGYEYRIHGARQATIFYKEVEESAGTAGIYAWEDDLYLLGKGPGRRERRYGMAVGSDQPDHGRRDLSTAPSDRHSQFDYHSRRALGNPRKGSS